MKSRALAALWLVFSCFGRFLESLLSDVFLDRQNVDEKSGKRNPGCPSTAIGVSEYGHRGALRGGNLKQMAS